LGIVPAFVVTGATPAGADAPKQVLAVVVAKDSGIRGMSFYDLKRTYMGVSTSVSGTRVVPFNFASGSRERTGFDKTVLNMSPEEAARYWIDRKIRGLPGSPRAVTPVAVLLKVVARLPGGVAYVDPKDVTAEVKAIPIDGKLPNDPGYPVKFVSNTAQALHGPFAMRERTASNVRR
jgi:hypothetical protein